MNSIKKNFIYNSLYQLLVIVVPLITTPYLSRILGATGIGEYSYAFSVSSYFVMFIMLGLNNYGNREVAKCRDNVNELSNILEHICNATSYGNFSCKCISCVYYERKRSNSSSYSWNLCIIRMF